MTIINRISSLMMMIIGTKRRKQILHQRPEVNHAIHQSNMSYNRLTICLMCDEADGVRKSSI
uniref:Uncharacterized protein n=1 Tax=Triticum urartu TaxID=4572 RepID=A0A8R7TLT2_TRIUA